MADFPLPEQPERHQSHPAAAIFPLLTGDQYDRLKNDIEANGLLTRIELFEGQVIDGRNRLRACRELGIEPDFMEIECDDPVAHVVSLNLVRRHLTTQQLGLCAARAVRVREKLEADATTRMKRGKRDPEDSGPQGDDDGKRAPQTRDLMGDMFGVSSKTVDRATRVEERGSAALVEAVEKGEVPLATAAKLADLSKAEQKTALKGGKDAIKMAVASAPMVIKPPHVAVRAIFERILKALEELDQGTGGPGKALQSAEWRKEQNSSLARVAQRAQNEIARWQAAMTQPAPQLSLVAQAAYKPAGAAAADEQELNEEDEDAS